MENPTGGKTAQDVLNAAIRDMTREQEEAVAKAGNTSYVLVYCAAGQNRSPCFALWYLQNKFTSKNYQVVLLNGGFGALMEVLKEDTGGMYIPLTNRFSSSMADLDSSYCGLISLTSRGGGIYEHEDVSIHEKSLGLKHPSH